MRGTVLRVQSVLLILPVLLAAVLIATSCARDVRLEGPSVTERLQEAADEVAPNPPVSSQAFLTFEQYRPLEMPASDGEAPAVQTYVLTRKDDLTQYPCSTCHVEPLEELEAKSEAEGKLQHWEITLNHASEGVLTCATCHYVEGENVDMLRSVTDQPIDFDASYQQCAQCHADAFDDWLGGAHGKRVGGWAEPRVIQGCADCHNPHAPQWDVRWPAMPPKEFDKGKRP